MSPFIIFKFIDMKKRILQFLTTYFLFVLLFVLQKPIFMVYYHELYTDASIGDYFNVCGTACLWISHWQDI